MTVDQPLWDTNDGDETALRPGETKDEYHQRMLELNRRRLADIKEKH